MEPTLVTLVTGCAALAVGSAAVVACAAAQIRMSSKQIAKRVVEIDSFSDVTYRRAREAVIAGREAQAASVDLIDRLIRFHGHDERVTGLLKAIERHREDARSAYESIAAYQEVIVNQGDQIGELRSREMDRIEEQELLEVELAATKAALAAEEGQADTWARTAANLGWTPQAPVAGYLGAAA